MKVIREVSKIEMVEKFPEVIDALNSPEEDVIYCDTCDGLRNKTHICRCWVCRKRLNECKCIENGTS